MPPQRDFRGRQGYSAGVPKLLASQRSSEAFLPYPLQPHLHYRGCAPPKKYTFFMSDKIAAIYYPKIQRTNIVGKS